MTGCKLIVHADDFGLSEDVNEGIVEVHRNGILTSTSLMVTGTAFDHAVRLSSSVPTLDIGVHLTLIEEEPLSSRNDISTLLDRNGCFYGHATTFIKRYFSGKVDLHEIRHELDAQIRRALDFGIKISHLDSHQHVHMIPGVRAVVRRLAEKYSIRAVRYPKERLRMYMLREKGAWTRLGQLLVLNTFCMIADTSGAKRPDQFFGFFFGGKLNQDNLWKIINCLPTRGTCELMCHPGLHHGGNRYSHWQYCWQDEFEALTNRGLKRRLEYERIELISYADLS